MMRLLTSMKIAPAKAAVIQREFMARSYSRIAPVYLVNEYPKSGGTWLKFMLSEAIGVPAWTKGALPWKSCVLQAHWMQPRGNCQTVALFRDGRDVMVSYYYHSFFRNEFQNGPYTRMMRERFGFEDYEDIRANLLTFVKVMIDAPISPKFSWVNFARKWATDDRVVTTRYEDLRKNTALELCRITKALNGRTLALDEAENIAANYSMDRMRDQKAKLNPGIMSNEPAEKSFIRSGSVGGWSEYFTDDALEWFEHRAGAELELLGYSLGRPSQSESENTPGSKGPTV